MKKFSLLLLAAGLFVSCAKQKIEPAISQADRQLAADLGFDPSAVTLSKPTGKVMVFDNIDSARKWIKMVSILHHSRSIKYAGKAPTSMPSSETNTFYDSYYHWASSEVLSGGQRQETVAFTNWFPGHIDGFKVSFIINYDPVSGEVVSVTSVQGRMEGGRLFTGFIQDNASASVTKSNGSTYVSYDISGDQYYGISIEGHTLGVTEAVRVRGTYNTATHSGSMHYEKN